MYNLFFFISCRNIIASGAGIPKQSNNENCYEVFKTLAKTVGVHIKTNDIEICHRIQGGSAILARFLFIGERSPYMNLLNNATTIKKKHKVFFKV